MKTEYIETLYNDFNRKVETIFKYLEIIKNQTTNTTEFLAEYVADYEKIYDAISKGSVQEVIPSDTQFAVESQIKTSPNEEVNNLSELTKKLENNNPILEYRFEELLRNLQFLSQSFQNYQNTTNKILEAWNATINMDQ